MECAVAVVVPSDDDDDKDDKDDDNDDDVNDSRNRIDIFLLSHMEYTQLGAACKLEEKRRQLGLTANSTEDPGSMRTVQAR